MHDSDATTSVTKNCYRIITGLNNNIIVILVKRLLVLISHVTVHQFIF